MMAYSYLETCNIQGELIMLFVIDPPPGQIPPPDRHVSINGTREAVE